MRVLIVTEYMTNVGGVQTYLQSLIQPLRSIVGELAVAANQIPSDLTNHSDRNLDKAGIEYWRADDKERAKQWKPDVVFYHGLRDPLLERWYAERFPTVLYAHNYHGTCISGTKCHANLGFRSCDRVLGPACLLAFVPFGCGGMNPKFILESYIAQRQRQSNLKLMRFVLVASSHMHAEFLRHGVDATRTVLAPLFPTGEYSLTSAPEPTSFRNKILVVSRLTPIKGVLLLPEATLRASERLNRKLTLVVAGDGPSDNPLKESAARWKIDIELLGWVDVATRSRLMQEADLLIAPSIWPEPFGLVGIEAGRLGLPSVGFRKGGMTDWLLPGSSGEFASGSQSTAVALADGIVKALHNASHWNNLRQGAWQVSQRFTLESHLSNLADVFSRV